MNEFAVWSESGQRFLEINEFAISLQGKIVLLRDGAIFDVVESGQEYILCRGISKTDIEGNEIYADSSIVEFTYFDAEPKNTETMRGYFSYKAHELGYVLNHSGDSEGYFHSLNNLKNLKIIDTLQENKLGLYDAE